MLVIDVEFGDLPAASNDDGWLDPELRRALADAIADELRDVEALMRRCEARVAALLDIAERSGVHRIDGHRTITSYAAATVNWSNAECIHRARTVNLVRALPEVADDLEAGDLAVAAVRELARVRANPRCGDQLTGEVADELIQNAKELPYEEFKLVAQRWEQIADVDGAHKGHEAAHAGRRVSTATLDDTFHLSAQFGSVQGAAILEILRRFEESEFQHEWDHLAEIHGDTMNPSLLERTRSQRRADALWAIFQAAIAVPADAKTPDPVVNIIIDQATFDDYLDAILNDTTPPAPDPADFTRRCETDTAAPVDPYVAVTAAVIGQVRRVVMDTKGVITDQGRRERLFKGSLRTAVFLMLGRRCIWPGCGRTLGIQIDHTTDWQHHGKTCTANGAPLCNWHNPFKNHGYRITRDDTGRWHTHRPDGTEIRPY